jgi:hypothetical protein
MNIKIVAYLQKLQDLDEYSGCESLRNYLIEESSKLDSPPTNITLDLRECWLDYGFSHLYLDTAIRLLLSNLSRPLGLEIMVSVDLGERHFMAALLFPHCEILDYKAEEGPEVLAEKLDRFCMENSINILIRSEVGIISGLNTRDFLFGTDGKNGV